MLGITLASTLDSVVLDAIHEAVEVVNTRTVSSDWILEDGVFVRITDRAPAYSLRLVYDPKAQSVGFSVMWNSELCQLNLSETTIKREIDGRDAEQFLTAVLALMWWTALREHLKTFESEVLLDPPKAITKDNLLVVVAEGRDAEYPSLRIFIALVIKLPSDDTLLRRGG